MQRIWGSFAVSSPCTYTLKACVYIFKKFSRTEILTQTHPPLSFLVVLPSCTSSSFLCQKLEFSLDRQKHFKKESGCELLSPLCLCFLYLNGNCYSKHRCKIISFLSLLRSLTSKHPLFFLRYDSHVYFHT